MFWTNRRVVLWVDSVPSPGKSKILAEIKVRRDYFTVWLHFFSTSGVSVSVSACLCWRDSYFVRHVNHTVFLWSSLPTDAPSCRARARPCAKCSALTACRHGNALHALHFRADKDNENKFFCCTSGQTHRLILCYLAKTLSALCPPRSSSDASLWPAEDSGKQSLKQDEGCWRCDNQPSLAVEGNISDGSSFSFSGPYIFCQVSYSQPQPGSSIRYPGAGNTSHTWLHILQTNQCPIRKYWLLRAWLSCDNPQTACLKTTMAANCSYGQVTEYG